MVCNRRQLPFAFLYPYVAGLRGIVLYLLQTCHQWLEGRLKPVRVPGLITVSTHQPVLLKTKRPSETIKFMVSDGLLSSSQDNLLFTQLTVIYQHILGSNFL